MMRTRTGTGVVERWVEAQAGAARKVDQVVKTGVAAAMRAGTVARAADVVVAAMEGLMVEGKAAAKCSIRGSLGNW